MELVLRGEVDPARAEAVEGEQAEGEVTWEARGPAQDLPGNVSVLVADRPLPMRRDFPATSGAVPIVGR